MNPLNIDAYREKKYIHFILSLIFLAAPFVSATFTRNTLKVSHQTETKSLSGGKNRSLPVLRFKLLVGLYEFLGFFSLSQAVKTCPFEAEQSSEKHDT